MDSDSVTVEGFTFCKDCSLCGVYLHPGFLSNITYTCTMRIEGCDQVGPMDGCTQGVPGNPSNAAPSYDVYLIDDGGDDYGDEPDLFSPGLHHR